MPGSALYEKFMALHTRPGGLVMPNAWDAPSALILADAGFEAVGTSSAAVAAILGRLDGQHAVTANEHIAYAAVMAKASGLPVNGDFEDGYGNTPDDVAATVNTAIDQGIAGFGIEDTTANTDDPIRGFDDAVARVRAAVRAADRRIVVVGRTDNYLQNRPDLDDTIRRLTAFAEAGADVLYAPGLPDLDSVKAVINAVAPKPVNVLAGRLDGRIPTVQELQTVGAKRISFGPDLYANALTALERSARSLRDGDIATATSGIGFGRIYQLVADAS